MVNDSSPRGVSFLSPLADARSPPRARRRFHDELDTEEDSEHSSPDQQSFPQELQRGAGQHDHGDGSSGSNAGNVTDEGGTAAAAAASSSLSERERADIAQALDMFGSYSYSYQGHTHSVDAL